MSLSAVDITLAGCMLPLVVASAFCSASETAVFSLSADDRSALRRQAPRVSKSVESLLAEPRQLLITVLLSNMSVNTLYLVISSALIAHGDAGVVRNVLFGIFTLLVVILGAEVLPKLLANAYRQRAVAVLAPPLHAWHQILGPVRRAIDLLVVAPLSRLTAPGDEPPRLSAAELGAMLSQSGAAGVIDADEQQVLRGVFELRRLRVRDVMTPRVDMAWIASTATRDEIMDLVASHRLTRLPVAGRGIDDVMGFLQVKRYLLDPRGANAPIVEHLRRPEFVPELASVEQVLEQLRSTRGDLAIVVDEYGGTAGVVAIEDCVEEIVGDIVSPEEEPESPPQMVAAGVWEVSGQMNLQRWADAFGERYLRSAASTLGGLVLERLGRPAHPGDLVHLGNVRLEVESVDGTRVRRVRVALDEERAAEGGLS